MKVRLLWAAPGSPLKCGEVYDLADGAQLIAGGDAEKAAKGVPALADPRPQPEAAPAPAADTDAAADAAADTDTDTDTDTDADADTDTDTDTDADADDADLAGLVLDEDA
ncbi:hypothetical protein [Phenylobacterium sp.]|uniref:hypothetical protein n=1 Tax=Phenylobacterium sp. TaxID=1871053 RepID=UPI0025F7CC05|nr:hypothetical protein [Phenylobacterium sp.]MCA6311240.1 hypothetical protein [Phenylobacterium sp.]